MGEIGLATVPVVSFLVSVEVIREPREMFAPTGAVGPGRPR